MKTCTRCKQQKTLSEFRKRRASKDGLTASCKICIRLQQKQQYLKYREERIKGVSARYFKNKAEGKPTWHDLNKEKRKAWEKEYQKIKNIQTQNYRARKKDLTRPIGWELTIEVWNELCKSYDNKCCYCRQDRVLTIEHILPLSRGGFHSIDNIAPACGRCNYSKRNKTLEEVGFQLYETQPRIMSEDHRTSTGQQEDPRD